MEKMSILFPNDEIELEYGKPVIIIGANGSGKTRFSAKIEELNDPAFNGNHLERSHIHRLPAQKSLTISTTIPIYDYDSSEKNLFLGNSEKYASKAVHRFHSNPITSLLDDYPLMRNPAKRKRMNITDGKRAERSVADKRAIRERH